jgi:hypothetical protein
MQKNMSLFAIAMLAALSAANAAPSPWNGCSLQNFKIDFGTYEAIDPPLPGYDYCASLQVTGTLKGRLISCGLWADFGVPSADIFGDDDFRFHAAKWFDIFETKGGTIFGTERGWVDFDSYYMQASMFVIEGGTGLFEGATGEFFFSPDWPNKATTASLGSGYICPAR